MWRLCAAITRHMTSGHSVSHCLSPGRRSWAPPWQRGVCCTSSAGVACTEQLLCLHQDLQARKARKLGGQGSTGPWQTAKMGLREMCSCLTPSLALTVMCTLSWAVPASLLPFRWVSPVWCLSAQRSLLPLPPTALLDVLVPPGPTTSYSICPCGQVCLVQCHGEQGLQFLGVAGLVHFEHRDNFSPWSKNYLILKYLPPGII